MDEEDHHNPPDQTQSGLDNSPYIGAPPVSGVSGTNGQEKVDLGQYVDQVRSFFRQTLSHSNLPILQTLLSVSPQLPLEIVMQMFRRMGYVSIFEPRPP